MENLATRDGWSFQKTFAKTPEKARRDYTIRSHPRIHAPPDYKSCRTEYARAKVDIVPETTRDVLANGLYCCLLSETSVGDNNCTALRTNAGRVLTSSFFLSCTLMFTTVL
jgi:hypothetical protein